MSIWGRPREGPEESPRQLDKSKGRPSASPPVRQPEPAPRPGVMAPGASPRTDSRTASRLCKSVHFAGEIHCDEDLFVDGRLEGLISMPNKTLVIGPNSDVRADIQARNLVLEGKLRGKAHVRERMQIKKRGNMHGDLVTHRLIIEDGAVYCGTSEVHPPEAKTGIRPAATPEPAVQEGRPAPPVRAKAKTSMA